MTGYAFNETSGFVDNGLKSSASELVTISNLDYSNCTNGVKIHIEYTDFASTWDRGRFIKIPDAAETGYLIDSYANSPSDAKFRIEDSSTHVGVSKTKMFTAGVKDVVVEIEFPNVGENKYDGNFSVGSTNYTFADELCLSTNANTAYDCVATAPLNTSNKIYLVNRLDYARTLKATLQKFWIEIL